MADVLQLPDRGKAARESIGRRFSVVTGKGRKVHRAQVYHVTYKTREHGPVEGAHVETDCGVALEFTPFDGRLAAEQVGERTTFREIEEGAGEKCQRCAAALGLMILGKSRKRALQLPRPPAEKAARPETFAQVKRRRERDELHDKFSRTLFGVSGAEVKRRRIVSTGKGRGTRYRLGAPDGSEGPGVA